MYPALAVVGALDERTEVLWVGGEGGIEQRLVRRSGLPFRAIPAAGVHGVGLRRLPGNVLALARGAWSARGLMSEFEPDVLFFTGGYVGAPVALAGLRRPKLTYVPDIEPALAQTWISRLADRVCVTTEQSRQHYGRPQRVTVTGYPSRFAAERPSRADGRAQFGLDDDLPLLLVLGGSKGARSINQALWRGLEQLLPHAHVLHLTGERDWEQVAAVRARLSEQQRARYHAHAYLHERMGHALAGADLTVSRAGASVLGDYPLFGLPALLVPYPHAWRYQRTNAAYLAERGAAETLTDEELASQLVPRVLSLLNDEARRRAMAASAAQLARPDAAQAIAAELRVLAGEAAA